MSAELRRRLVEGDRKALEEFKQLSQDAEWARRWLEQFGVVVVGEGPFADNVARALALYNATAILPVQPVRDNKLVIKVRPAGSDDPYIKQGFGAYTAIYEGADKLEIVYSPSQANNRLLSAHEAAHIIQNVANQLYGVDASYDPLVWESMAESLARWLVGMYRYDPETAKSLAQSLLKGAGNVDIWRAYKLYPLWPLGEPGDYRQLVARALRTSGFYEMIRDIAEGREPQAMVKKQTTTQDMTITKQERQTITQDVTTAENKVQLTESKDQAKAENIGTVVGEFSSNIPLPPADKVVGERHTLPELLKRYATESGKVVFYARDWDFFDPATGRHVRRNIAWLGDVERKGERELVRVKYRCVEYEDGWRCTEETRGIPTQVPFVFDVVHKGNVVAKAPASELGRYEIDLKHGQGTPWERLRETQTTQTVASGPTGGSSTDLPSLGAGDAGARQLWEQITAEAGKYVQPAAALPTFDKSLAGVINQAAAGARQLWEQITGAVAEAGKYVQHGVSELGRLAAEGAKAVGALTAQTVGATLDKREPGIGKRSLASTSLPADAAPTIDFGKYGFVTIRAALPAAARSPSTLPPAEAAPAKTGERRTSGRLAAIPI